MPPGLADIVRAFKMPRLILYMAWSDIRARYKRSVLGPFWITLSTAIGVVGLGFIWSELFKMDRASFIPLLTIGLILWQFMSACIIESTTVFSRQAHYYPQPQPADSPASGATGAAPSDQSGA